MVYKAVVYAPTSLHNPLVGMNIALPVDTHPSLHLDKVSGNRGSLRNRIVFWDFGLCQEPSL